jgi:hypothetical protein
LIHWRHLDHERTKNFQKGREKFEPSNFLVRKLLPAVYRELSMSSTGASQNSRESLATGICSALWSGDTTGNRTVDILFHPNIQSIILSEGRAEKNNYVGNGISVQIRRAGDVGYAFELLLKSYHLRKQTTANEYNQQSVISI